MTILRLLFPFRVRRVDRILRANYERKYRQGELDELDWVIAGMLRRKPRRVVGVVFDVILAGVVVCGLLWLGYAFVILMF